MDELKYKAGELSSGNWLQRLWSASRDADTLIDLEKGIKQALEEFKAGIFMRNIERL